LLAAAAEMVSAAPGEDVPLRAVCDKVGVKLPTLFHFFGNKEGLLRAVAEHGFELLADALEARDPCDDAIEDVEAYWDTHVAFGIANAGFYMLMYGQPAYGSAPPEQDRPTSVLMRLLRRADRQGRLVVSPKHAAAHVTVACVGVTLRQIGRSEPDPRLSAAVRQATIRAVTEPLPDDLASGIPDLASIAKRPMRSLAADAAGTELGPEELRLLKKWATLLGRNGR